MRYRMRPTVANLTLLAAALIVTAAEPALARPSPAPSPAPTPISLSLSDAMSLALTNNLTYKAAAQDVIAAEGQLIQARGSAYPSVSAGYAYIHTQDPAYFILPVPQPVGPPIPQKALFSATDTNNVNATLQYAIYSGGAVQAAIGAAAAGFSASQSNLAAVRADVLNQTTASYYGLVLARKTASIDDEAVDVGKQNLQTSQQLYAAGTVAKADVLRQQVTLANAQVAAVRAHNAA